MKDMTRQIIIEVSSTILAVAVEVWYKITKSSKGKGGEY